MKLFEKLFNSTIDIHVQLLILNRNSIKKVLLEHKLTIYVVYWEPSCFTL